MYSYMDSYMKLWGDFLVYGVMQAPLATEVHSLEGLPAMMDSQADYIAQDIPDNLNRS